jgi:hypothetical protein
MASARSCLRHKINRCTVSCQTHHRARGFTLNHGSFCCDSKGKGVVASAVRYEREHLLTSLAGCCSAPLFSLCLPPPAPADLTSQEIPTTEHSQRQQAWSKQSTQRSRAIGHHRSQGPISTPSFPKLCDSRKQHRLRRQTPSFSAPACRVRSLEPTKPTFPLRPSSFVPSDWDHHPAFPSYVITAPVPESSASLVLVPCRRRRPSPLCACRCRCRCRYHCCRFRDDTQHMARAGNEAI